MFNRFFTKDATSDNTDVPQETPTSGNTNGFPGGAPPTRSDLAKDLEARLDHLDPQKRQERAGTSWLLLVVASLLSISSLVWTFHCIYDLFKPEDATSVDLATLTAALAADLVWAVVLVAEWKNYQLGFHRTKQDKQKTAKQGQEEKRSNERQVFVNLTPYIGWALLLTVVALLVAHGLIKGNSATAFAGWLFPVGAKIAWLFVIASQRDPLELPQEQRRELDELNIRCHYLSERTKAETELKRLQYEADRVSKKAENEAELADLAAEHTTDRAKQEAKLRKELDQIHADGEAKIGRIKANAEVKRAQQDTDYELIIERENKNAELFTALRDGTLGGIGHVLGQVLRSETRPLPPEPPQPGGRKAIPAQQPTPQPQPAQPTYTEQPAPQTGERELEGAFPSASVQEPNYSSHNPEHTPTDHTEQHPPAPKKTQRSVVVDMGDLKGKQKLQKLRALAYYQAKEHAGGEYPYRKYCSEYELFEGEERRMHFGTLSKVLSKYPEESFNTQDYEEYQKLQEMALLKTDEESAAS